MSSSYFKLKLLKQKQIKRLQTKTVKEPKTKLKSASVGHQSCQNKCRICLNVGVIPIFGDQCTDDLPDAVRTIGGVELSLSDELPKHLCKDCHSLLIGAILFRKSAQESDETLRTSLAESLSINDDNVDYEESKLPDQTYQCKNSRLNTVHKNTKHRNVRIQCQICHRVLTSQLYERHLKRHEAASHLVCDICGKLYRKDNLIRHLQLHSNELPFQCQICPYRGRFMESLKIHMRTHSGDKPFSCDKCQLKFITKSNLNRHYLTHQKEKPFNCSECSRGFYTQKDLDTHLIVDHVGNKEFGCRLCGNKYGTKKALMRHELRVHKREKMAKGRMPLYLQAEFQNNNNLF